MAGIVRDVMTSAPLTVGIAATLENAAQVMRSHDVGDVLVTDGDHLHGILTDRDIVVRAVAAGREPASTPVGEYCSKLLHTVEVSATTDQAAALMRQHALRRLPVLDNGDLVGVVSLGDLAVSQDPKSALADISAASPNK